MRIPVSTLLFVLLSAQVLTAAAPSIDDQLSVLHLDSGTALLTTQYLKNHDVPILAHIGVNTILVSLPEELRAHLPGILTSGPWSATDAISPRLTRAMKSHRQDSTRVIQIIIGLAPGSNAAELRTRLTESGVRVAWIDNSASRPELGLKIDGTQLENLRTILLERSDLIWADQQAPVRLRNSESVWRCQSGTQNKTTIFEKGINGSNQIIAIMDTGIDADMCYFSDADRGLPPINDQLSTTVDIEQRKIIAVDFYWSADWPNPSPFDWDDHSHGTHVAGSAAGDSDIFGQHDGFDGMAPAAKLVIQDGGYRVDPCGDLPGLGCPMQNLEPMLSQAWNQGARIHSNSWGDEEDAWPTNGYTERTADIDRFVWQHDDMLVLNAAGNGGGWGDDTIGSPSTGKNLVAVGATINGAFDPPCPVNFSSRGWTHDGRIKPDILAPGHNIGSAHSDFNINSNNCDLVRFSGTSMACPTAAGLSALIRQYFVDGFYPDGEATPSHGFTPSAALLKATLIASAVDVTSLGCRNTEPIPSREQGWGLIQLDNALSFHGDRQRLFVFDYRDGLEHDSVINDTVYTNAKGALKAVLVWTDPPSSSTAAINLVNDLDLVIEGPNGRFLGNAFANGVSITGTVRDRLNNVEVVYIPEAEAGAWHFSIETHTLVEGPQNFALVITGPLGENLSRNPKPARRFSPLP